MPGPLVCGDYRQGAREMAPCLLSRLGFSQALFRMGSLGSGCRYFFGNAYATYAAAVPPAGALPPAAGITMYCRPLIS